MLEAVTAEEIQKIAREFFQSDRLAASVVGSPGQLLASLTREQLAL